MLFDKLFERFRLINEHTDEIIKCTIIGSTISVKYMIVVLTITILVELITSLALSHVMAFAFLFERLRSFCLKTHLPFIRNAQL